MDIPSRIYKYEPFSAKSIQNLKAQSLYFGSPLAFNDPYDCALHAGVEVPTKEELKKLKDYYVQDPSVPEHIREEFETKDITELRDILIRSVETTLQQHAETFLKTKGVTCFSECNDDLLMWSHYGGRYKGFCLEFSTKHEPFTKMRKVVYTNEMPKLNAAAILLEDNYDKILELFCTKSKSWNYEKEWRSIHNNVGTLFTYEASALESVYFGPDIDRESMEIICLILAGQNPDVTLWRGIRSKDKFEVNFQRFTYTSHSEAKRQGLIP